MPQDSDKLAEVIKTVSDVSGLKATVEMHIQEDDKRFSHQGEVNIDLYRRIDQINFKLWAIGAGIIGLLLEVIIQHFPK